MHIRNGHRRLAVLDNTVPAVERKNTGRKGQDGRATDICNQKKWVDGMVRAAIPLVQAYPPCERNMYMRRVESLPWSGCRRPEDRRASCLFNDEEMREDSEAPRTFVLMSHAIMICLRKRKG